MVCLGLATAALARGRWLKQRLQQRPFGIAGIGWVVPWAVGGWAATVMRRRVRGGRLARGLLERWAGVVTSIARGCQLCVRRW
jgi:hypothetical protein